MSAAQSSFKSWYSTTRASRCVARRSRSSARGAKATGGRQVSITTTSAAASSATVTCLKRSPQRNSRVRAALSVIWIRTPGSSIVMKSSLSSAPASPPLTGRLCSTRRLAASSESKYRDAAISTPTKVFRLPHEGPKNACMSTFPVPIPKSKRVEALLDTSRHSGPKSFVTPVGSNSPYVSRPVSNFAADACSCDERHRCPLVARPVSAVLIVA
mmetsp:Transcript_78592/g.153735  ORF Transcript_78592/g.153735 Transcript_78592/m.153735 type:complete len:214 (+) Transcript_78592:922-1563(+)